MTTTFERVFHPDYTPWGQKPMYDNIMERAAMLSGYTKLILANAAEYNLTLLVRPSADLDGSFRAFCVDENEYITVNGWLFNIEED